MRGMSTHKALRFGYRFTGPNCLRITTRPTNISSTKLLFLYVKRHLHVSDT